MSGWEVLEGHSLGKIEPASRSRLYATEHTARAMAKAVGYSACVMRQDGDTIESLFYRGSGQDLWKKRKVEAGSKLVINLSGDDAGSADDDSWEIIDADGTEDVIVGSLCRHQDEQSAAYQEAKQSRRAHNAMTDEFWADLAAAPSAPPSHAVVVYEHERWIPIYGWTAAPFFHRDADHFTYHDGTLAPKLELVSPPRGTDWEPTGARSRWNYDSALAGGWEYSMDFSVLPYHSQVRMTDLVRRRRWTRYYLSMQGDDSDSSC